MLCFGCDHVREKCTCTKKLKIRTMNKEGTMYKDCDGKAFIWSKEGTVEASAMEQIWNMSQHSHLSGHIAIMPDVHAGQGAVIGSVIPMDGVLLPSAVGVDIGCGMCAVKTNLKFRELEGFFGSIHDQIKRRIPMGFSHRNMSERVHRDDLHKFVPPMFEDKFDEYNRIYKSRNNVIGQLGTLGGGNHFIELQADKDTNIWIMIHSGSRNIGNLVARRASEDAKRLSETYRLNCPKDLEFLPDTCAEGKRYISEMRDMVDFALLNRSVMMNIIKDIFGALNNYGFKPTFDPMINIAHNYAALENHFGKNVWVHRKGATRVRDDVTGIIPGSMGSSSYIVTGTNNNDSYHSCSHGAGRTMGRKVAKRTLNMDDFSKSMVGIYSKSVDEEHLDEAPEAYKDISVVMGNQKDLIKIETELIPVFNIKG